MFPGFNNKKRGTISNGDWDRDGVKNRKDCEPLNWRKQGPEHEKAQCVKCGAKLKHKNEFLLCRDCLEDKKTRNQESGLHSSGNSWADLNYEDDGAWD